MSISRKDRIIPSLKRLVNEFLLSFKMEGALITVTGITLSKDYKRCTILVTIFPDEKELAGLEMLSGLKKNVEKFIRSKTRTRVHPLIDFQLDLGEKNRQRIDSLLDEDRNNI